jgi:succinate-semialdehyde dehydrogenase/glutarate-semialdehyde dehydrogenase
VEFLLSGRVIWVRSFYKVGNEQEAIDPANDSPFGLGGSIFTKDTKRATIDQIDSGMIFINQPTATQPDLPFEEIQRLRLRTWSELGIHEFGKTKLIE